MQLVPFVATSPKLSGKLSVSTGGELSAVLKLFHWVHDMPRLPLSMISILSPNWITLSPPLSAPALIFPRALYKEIRILMFRMYSMLYSLDYDLKFVRIAYSFTLRTMQLNHSSQLMTCSVSINILMALKLLKVFRKYFQQ